MTEFPRGTVTFLFTDIEGSTGRWERAPAAMAAAVTCHVALLRAAITAQDGVLFKIIGDAIQAAFPTAPAAVAAALTAQRALAAERWDDEIGTLRVRMALHTATAEPREGDYLAPGLNRLARLLAAGHGGQILLSETTEELARHAFPAGVTVRNLGEHRLRDLLRPERAFQLTAADLRAEFPPLRTVGYQPTNLPPQPTTFIGRDHDIETVTALLGGEQVRLLTVTGPGGVGKTRLAMQVATDLLPAFVDGVFVVSLAAVTDPDLVPATIAATLGLREESGRSLDDQIRSYLRDRHLLLVLDNLEHLLDAAEFVAELLAACPRLTVVVTSRTPLRVYGEREYPLRPLLVPAADAPTDVITANDAVRLFADRARAVKPDFALTPPVAATVAAICGRLDGLPLAIELAAARIKLMTPDALLRRLAQRLPLLTSGARNLPARQQTMHATIAWSYELLSPAEQSLFRLLSVFAGGFTPEAAEAVRGPQGAGAGYPLGGGQGAGESLRPVPCPLSPAASVFDGIASLVDKSLLRQVVVDGDEERFGMLETVREFGLAQLRDAGEEAAVRHTHTTYFVALAEEAEAALTGTTQREWLARLTTEHDNIRAALDQAIAATDSDAALRLAGALWRFWYARGHLTEGSDRLERALALGGGEPAILAKAHHGAGVLSANQGDSARAAAHYEASLALRREMKDELGVANTLNNLGILAYQRGDDAAATTLYEECLAIRRRLADKRGIAYALAGLAVVARRQGDYDQAAARYEESLTLTRALNDAGGIARLLHNLGFVALLQGEPNRAQDRFDECLRRFSDLGDKDGISLAQYSLGLVALGRDALDEAADQFRSSLRIRWDLSLRPGIADCLLGLAQVAARRGETAAAVRLAGAAAALRETTGAPWTSHEQTWMTTLSALSENSAEAADAWEDGRHLPLAEVVAAALRTPHLDRLVAM